MISDDARWVTGDTVRVDAFADLNERLGQVSFVAGERYSAADITAVVTVAKALELSVPADHAALKRWYETVSSRPSATA